MQRNISIALYQNIFQTKNPVELPIDIFLDRVKDGYWQDIVLPLRALPSKDERSEAKKRVPYVTLSGFFAERKDSSEVSHSGFIGIDIDDVDPEETKSILCPDRYVYAAFTSIGGRGVCAVFKINPAKHREAFNGIAEYLMEQYGITIDPTGINPSRARFISFDPELYHNPDANKFEQYQKVKEPKKIESVVFVQSDFDTAMERIQRERINICNNYTEWRNCGFALADKLGEAGRSYFHTISQISSNFRPDSQACNDRLVDRQYTACMKGRGSVKVTIATLYYYCKQAGLELYSERTKTIITAAALARQGKRTISDTVQNLAKFEAIPAAESEQIVEQVFQSDIQPPTDSEIDQIEQWLRHNYNLRKNVITRQVEENGIPLADDGRNSIWRAAKKVFDGIKADDLNRLINSDFTPQYNPLHDFFTDIAHRNPTGCIDSLFDTILSTDYEYTRYFGKKWLVGVVASVYGGINDLMPVLSGPKHGTGKTEWYRRMVPLQLEPYYAEISSGIKENDFNILMAQKILLLDDEYEAKRKKEDNALKSLLSKKTFDLREPYGRSNITLRRLASLCATSNDEDLLTDTMNRRIIPIPVLAINQQDYNRIDKLDVWAEAYHLYRSGFSHKLTREDIARLEAGSYSFEKHSMEYELLMRFFDRPGQYELPAMMTATEIKNKLETVTMQRLQLDRIGKELKRLGFENTVKWQGGKSMRLYSVVFREHGNAQNNTPPATDLEY